MKPELGIQFEIDVIDKHNKVKFFEREGKYLFWNRVYAKGEDMDKVKEITYIVHPSFPNPVRRVRNRESGFELIIWAWGEFTIKIIITTKDEEEYYRDFFLGFGDKLEEAHRRDVVATNVGDK